MKKFLICEDDRDMVDFLHLFLKSKGYDYEIVEEGALVVPTLQNKDFCFLLLDLNLPDMDGKEVIKQIRHDSRIKNTHIVIFSASIKTKKLVDELDVQGYIEKPFQLGELENTINAIIKG